MMSKNIILSCNLLHSKQIRTNQVIVLWVHEINLLGIKTSLFVGEDEILVLFHAEEEFPAVLFSVIFINDGDAQCCTRGCFKKGNHIFLEVACVVPINGNMMIAACIDKVNGNIFALGIQNGLAILVPFVM